MSSKNKWVRIVPIIALLLGVFGTTVVVPVTPVANAATINSVNLANVFQLDGNAQTCPSGGTLTKQDWDTAIASAIKAVYPSYVAPNCTYSTTSPPPTPLAKDFIHDSVSGGGDTSIFTGGTSKDNCEISTAADNPCSGAWGWSPTAGLQDKDDLTNVYAGAYSVANSSTGKNDLVLTFGSDRYSDGGDAQQSFWFTQNKIGLNPTPGQTTCTTSSGCTFSGTHKFGDLLVQVNFTTGGSVGGVSVFQWIGSTGTAPTGCTVVGTALCQLFPASGTAAPDCSTATTTSTGVCAIVSSITAGIPSPWAYQEKNSGSTKFAANTFGPGTFMEGAVDITALFGQFGETNPCITQYIAETRSSQSTTSTTSDFAANSFPLCSAGVSIDAGNVNPVGIPHTFTINATQTASGTSAPADSASLTASINSTNSTAKPAAIYLGTSVGTNNGSAASCSNFPSSPPQSVTGSTTAGVMKVTVLSCTPGTVYVDVSGTVTPNGSAPINVSTSATTSSASGDPCNPNCGVKTYADGYIVISPLTATNLSGTLHTLTATVYKATAPNAYTLASGSTVTFTLLNDNNGATIQASPANPCTTGTNGQCSIKIDTTSVGSTDIQASALFDSTVIPGLSQSFTRTTGTTDNSQNSGNANKLYVNGRISISPPTPTNSVGTPETFTITVEQATSQNQDGTPHWVAAPSGMSVSYSIVPNADASATPSGATFVANSTTGPVCPTTGAGGNSLGSGPLTGTTGNGGTLQVTVLSCNTGKITVHASTQFTATQFPGLPVAQNFTRATGDSTNTSLGGTNDAVKTYKAGSIQIEKTVQLGPLTPAPNICFTLSLTNGNTIPVLNGANPQCYSGWTRDPNKTDGTSLPHTYSWTGLASGTYRVIETTTSFPYNLGNLYDSNTQTGYTSGISVDAVNGTFPIDLTPNAPWTNPLPPGQLQVLKNLNGQLDTTIPFSFTATYCTDTANSAAGTVGSGGACGSASSTATYTFNVPGCNWDTTNAAQPTNCNPLVNPVTLSSLPEGYYKINENAKTGYATDTNVYVVAVYSDNNAATSPHTVPLTTFNNTQKFRIVAFACNMTDSLVPANVSLATGDSSRGTNGLLTGTTLSASDLTSWNTANGNSSVTEAQICHLETNGADSGNSGGSVGGNFPNLNPTTGSYSPSIGPLPPQ